MPYNLPQILGDAFKEQGVEVFYSVEDNDDTLAYYAHADGATILSKDNDFWRYVPCPQKVYKDFNYGYKQFVLTDIDKNHWIKFIEAFKVNIKEEDKRLIFSEAPQTNKKCASATRVLTDKPFCIFGAPTALLRYTGNPHSNVRELRQAVYANLGVTKVVYEVEAFWDSETR